MQDERQRISRQLDEVERTLKELRVLYEQYFSGVEKIAPIKKRDDLERQLRLLGHRKIVQTELRYRLQNMSSSFHSYKGMWERTQRQMDESRYVRHTKKIAANTAASEDKSSVATSINSEQLYQDYLRMCKECKVPVAIGGISSMETFMRNKKEAVQQRYGDIECSFSVVSENGKPRIKVKLKR